MGPVRRYTEVDLDEITQDMFVYALIIGGVVVAVVAGMIGWLA